MLWNLSIKRNNNNLLKPCALNLFRWDCTAQAQKQTHTTPRGGRQATCPGCLTRSYAVHEVAVSPFSLVGHALFPGGRVGNQEHWSFVRHTEALLASTATTTTVQLHVHVRDGCTAKRRTAAPDTEHSSLFQLHFRLMWPKLNMTAQTPSDTEDAWHARSVGSPYSALQNLHVAPGPGVVAASVAPRVGLPSPPSTAPHILQGRGGREKQKCSQGTTSSTCNVMLQSCSKCRITKCLYVHSKLTGNTDPSAHTAVTQHAVDARSVSCFSLRDLQSKS